LINAYLRSIVSQGNLSDLTNIAIENYLLNFLDINNILREFEKLKARKVRF